MTPKPIVRETFDLWWSLNNETGCHEWTRSLSAQGYGQLNIGHGKLGLAHRFAWERANGQIANGLHVLHRCDNRKCVNVSHLFLGTNLDNIRDMHAKGRAKGGTLSGEAVRTSKLTWGDVGAIRSLYASGEYSQRKLAIQFGIAQTTIGVIVRREHWAGDSGAPTSQRGYMKPSAPRRRSYYERLNELIERADSGCMVWHGYRNPDGYGFIRVPGDKKAFVHRIMFERVFGSVPTGMVLRHSCDRRDCVNPAHLRIGTQADNVADMVSKGRQRSGHWGKEVTP